MASDLPPGWTELTPQPKARQPKELIAHVNQTFHRFLDHYKEESGHEIEYALIADGGNRRLLIAVLNEDQYPDEEVEIGDTITVHSEFDQTVKYEIIGSIKDLEIIMTCDDTRFKTFFTSTGKKLLRDVRVQDRVSERIVERLYGEVKAVEAQRAEAKREKRLRQDEAREALTNASVTTATTEQSSIDPEAAERKREKARRKRQNQKNNRAERAEQAEEEERQHQRKMEEIQKQLDEQNLDGEVVDPNTEEGRKKIEEAMAKGGARLCQVPSDLYD